MPNVPDVMYSPSGGILEPRQLVALFSVDFGRTARLYGRAMPVISANLLGSAGRIVVPIVSLLFKHFADGKGESDSTRDAWIGILSDFGINIGAGVATSPLERLLSEKPKAMDALGDEHLARFVGDLLAILILRWSKEPAQESQRANLQLLSKVVPAGWLDFVSEGAPGCDPLESQEFIRQLGAQMRSEDPVPMLYAGQFSIFFRYLAKKHELTGLIRGPQLDELDHWLGDHLGPTLVDIIATDLPTAVTAWRESVLRFLSEHQAQLLALSEQVHGHHEVSVANHQATQAMIAELKNAVEKLQSGSLQLLEQSYAAAIQIIAEKHHVSIGKLEEKIAEWVSHTLQSESIGLRDKVQALRAAGRFLEARDFALAAAEEAAKMRQTASRDEVEMLIAVIDFETAFGENSRALEFVLRAENLIDPQEDFKTFEKIRHTRADILMALGRYSEAEQIFRELAALSCAQLGPTDWASRQNKRGIARALNFQGKYREAEELYHAALLFEEQNFGAHAPLTLLCRADWIEAQSKRGETKDSESELREVLRQQELHVPPDGQCVWSSRSGLASKLRSKGKFEEAEELYRKILKFEEETYGAEHETLFADYYNFAMCLRDQGKFTEALVFANKAEAGYRRALGEGHVHHRDAVFLVSTLELMRGNTEAMDTLKDIEF